MAHFCWNFSCKSAILLNFSKVEKNSPKEGTFSGKFLEKVRFFLKNQKCRKKLQKRHLFWKISRKTALFLDNPKLHKKSPKKGNFLQK
jgi:hypothetical protein